MRRSMPRTQWPLRLLSAARWVTRTTLTRPTDSRFTPLRMVARLPSGSILWIPMGPCLPRDVGKYRRPIKPRPQPMSIFDPNWA